MGFFSVFIIKHLVEQFEREASMERKLLESVEIHVIPNFNPDGYAKAIPGSCYGSEGRYVLFVMLTNKIPLIIVRFYTLRLSFVRLIIKYK